MQNYGIFCQFRSKLAITHTIAIKWKEKNNAVVVDCHHRMKMSLPKKKKKFKGDSYFFEGPIWAKFRPLVWLFCPSRPLACSLIMSLLWKWESLGLPLSCFFSEEKIKCKKHVWKGFLEHVLNLGFWVCQTQHQDSKCSPCLILILCIRRNSQTGTCTNSEDWRPRWNAA